MTVRALLCCETGQGRGHVTTLATMARALEGRFTLSAALSRLDHAGLLALFCRRIEQAPVLSRRPDHEVLAPQSYQSDTTVAPCHAPVESGAAPVRFADSWANWLGRRGFRHPGVIHHQVRWWQDAIWRHRADLVIADYAPCALLAARALNVPAAVTGTAIGIAPPRMPHFPLLSADGGDVLLDEGETLDIVNAALAPLGMPELPRLTALYDCALQLPRGFDFWDPYRLWRDDGLLLPLARHPPLSTGGGDTIFTYLSTNELDEPAIAEALARTPLPVTLVAPGIDTGRAAALGAANPRLTLAQAPLEQAEIVRRARVILCAGQAGTAALAILSGIPMLALPQHNEQACNARGAAGLGTNRMLMRPARSAGAICAALESLWEDGMLSERARQTAGRLRATGPSGALEGYGSRLHDFLSAHHGTGFGRIRR